ncbi:MAG: bifunctional phosphoglucose/phosphomannose isomerase [Candidatus Thermoplasmatota archaeon]|nr:bifunctional phosphoglucose/phosphomannose isomerase [Candidatus Thermoplasmatota archaeon]
MLNELKTIEEIDKSGMLNDIANFPEQIKEAEKIVENSNITSIYKIDNIIISGMGASAISGDIIQSLLRDRIDIPIFITRHYDLPKWANKNTLVFSQSYSGNTEETLSTFKHAFQKHCKIIAISSGGKLKEYCEKREVPFIKIPSGLQPRTATGYILFCSIYTLKKIGLLQQDINQEIQETIQIAEEFRNNNKKEVPEEKNLSKQLARKLFNKIPQVYAWDFYIPIAKRWCTQLNENSKLICRYDEVPECTHNDIVGWSMNSEVSKKFICILFRDHENESIYTTKRLNFMKKLFEDVAGDTIEVPIIAKKRLSKMIYAMYLGDYVSCYLAILRKIDPTPVEAIQQLKEELAKI